MSMEIWFGSLAAVVVTGVFGLMLKLMASVVSTLTCRCDTCRESIKSLATLVGTTQASRHASGTQADPASPLK